MVSPSKGSKFRYECAAFSLRLGLESKKSTILASKLGCGLTSGSKYLSSSI